MFILRQQFDEISSTQKHPVGLRVFRPGTDEEFIYSQAGASDLNPGMLALAAADVDNHINIAVATNAAIGDQKVQVTLGATAATADQYRDGSLMVNDATGEGHKYLIESHPAADASASLWVTLKPETRIKVALVAGTSEVTLCRHPNRLTVESATEENCAVGITPVSVTANYYYWAQVGGLACCLIDGTPAVGTSMVPGSVAGSLKAIPTPLDIDVSHSLGQKVQGAGVDTEYGPVRLTM